jgi:hypothetical protein
MRTESAFLFVIAALGALPLAAANSARAEQSTESSVPRGRPKVVLDRLLFPEEVPAAAVLVKHLRQTLAREARRADWGAARGSRIEYRFSVTELSVRRHGDVLRVRCTAFGKLPSGKTAKSHLDYGGDPRAPTDVVKRVLEMVARGVITRLAELERVRRGELERARVRLPASGVVD